MAPRGFGKKIRVGRVAAQRLGAKKWRLRYFDPNTGADVRRTVDGITEGEVEAIAGGINREILVARGIIPATMLPVKTSLAPPLSVRDAMTRAIAASPARAMTKRIYVSSANRFLEYLEASGGAVRHWRDVTPGVIGAYAQACLASGKSAPYVRNVLKIVSQVSRYWADEEPALYRNVAAVAMKRIRLPQAESYDRSIEKKVLAPAVLWDLLAALKKRSLVIWGMATVQAFAGLDVSETAWLCEDDYDPERGVLAVRTNKFHAVKNSYRAREIPVLPAVALALAECLREGGPRSEHGLFFRTPRGYAFSYFAIQTKWAEAIADVRKSSEVAGLPAAFTPRKLRATFATMASRAGAARNLIRRYMGHAAEDILGAHYEAVGIEELRCGVLAPLETYLRNATEKVAKEDAE